MQGIRYLAICERFSVLTTCIVPDKVGYYHDDMNVFDAKSNPLTTGFTFPY